MPKAVVFSVAFFFCEEHEGHSLSADCACTCTAYPVTQIGQLVFFYQLLVQVSQA